MNESNVTLAEAYYKAYGGKNLSGMEKYLHPDVSFIGPLANMTGKESVLEAAKRLLPLFKSLTIRAKFGSGDQVMLAYDLDCPAPIGIFRTAVLMTFKDKLIAGIELFYDARPFDTKKDEIFKKS